MCLGSGQSYDSQKLAINAIDGTIYTRFNVTQLALNSDPSFKKLAEVLGLSGAYKSDDNLKSKLLECFDGRNYPYIEHEDSGIIGLSETAPKTVYDATEQG